MNVLFRMLCLSVFGLWTASAAPTEERIWTGINGKTFRGSFITLDENGTKAVFFTSTRQQVIVAVDNLIQADRDLLLGRVTVPSVAPAPATGPTPTPTPAAPPVVDTGDGFKKLPNANRTLIPDVKPEDLGESDDEALVDAIWVSFLWWEKNNILEVPGRGDYAKRAEQLHEELTRKIARGGNSSASLEEAKEGVEAYFKDELSDTATCRVKILKNLPAVPAIAATLVDARAVVMKMSMTYDNSRDFSVATALESLTPEGKFAFRVFGIRLHGEVKTDATGKQEWIVANRDAMPEHYRNQGAKFYLNPNGWNGLLLIDPFVYKTKGKPSPLPPEEQIKPTAPDKPEI